MAKKKTKKASAAKNKSETMINEAIASALNSAKTVLMKVCRLCENKDGPFLNIFDADQVTAKKIEELMPFVVAKDDDLPHKICFRCSAKVEELYDFIQRCIKTQHNLHSNTGKNAPILKKTKQRATWEEKLNKSTLSNDIICDVLIKKAMQGIEDIPLNPKLLDDQVKQSTIEDKSKTEEPNTKNAEYTVKHNNASELTLKNVKLAIEKVDEKVSAGSKSNENSPGNNSKSSSKTKTDKDLIPKTNDSTKQADKENDSDEAKVKIKPEIPNVAEIEKQKEAVFNIMDHVSKIKVNGVGILFQCKLCNKNFLKMEVVESHGCAKNGAPKIDFTKRLPPPQPPKAPTVKYIKMDNNLKKNKEAIVDSSPKLTEHNKTEKAEVKLPQPTADPPPKPKPKIGPASRVKRQPSLQTNKEDSLLLHNTLTSQAMPPKETPMNTEVNQAPPLFPVVTFPMLPKLNGRYSFVPGPNNTFTLVEEESNIPIQGNVTMPSIVPNPNIVQTPSNVASAGTETPAKPSVKKVYTPGPKSKKVQKLPRPEIIELDDNDQPSDQPYPVGLFKTANSVSHTPPVSELPAFAMPAMKKQLYTVVQTGNPSKLLISSKPVQALEEPLKKRIKKSKHEVKESTNEPYKVTLEDATPAKDPGIFTFINVDPLLQPSYVLPTESIQESQISTSTQAVGAAEKKEKDSSSKLYSCNMCNNRFTREKKLLSHIQSHYTKMDEEDQLREKSKRRKMK